LEWHTEPLGNIDGVRLLLAGAN